MSNKSLSVHSSVESVDVNDVLTRLTRARIPNDIFDASAFSPFKYLDWDARELNNWLDTVEDAVDALVNKYHKGFNTSTNTFTAVLGSFTACQKHCLKVEDATAESRRLIQNRSQKRLYALHIENLKLQYAVKIMDRVIEMASIPSLIKKYLDRRQYLHSVVLLNRAIYAYFDDDLKDIAGLKEINDRLLETRNHLSTELLDQIDVHIYTVQSKSVVQAHNSGVAFDDHCPDLDHGSDSAPQCSLDINLNDDKRAADIDLILHPLLVEESSFKYLQSPNRDRIRYITLLMHALHRLQRLPAARTTLLKHIRPALRSIVETETNSIKEKSSQALRSQMTLRQGSDWTFDIINELLGRIFETFKSVLQTHITICRLFSELENGPAGEEVFSINRIWFEMQNEAWVTILSYLQSSGRSVIPNLRQDSGTNLSSWQSSMTPAQLSFAFADSAIPTARLTNSMTATSVPDAPGEMQTSQQSWIPSHPENILAVYRPVMNFIEYATTLGVVQRKYQGNILHDLLQQYVNTSGIPRARIESHKL